MSNYFANLPAYRPGPGIDFEPVNNALAAVTQQNNRNALMQFEGQKFDAQQKQQQFENSRQSKQDQLASIKRGAEQANAIDQMFPVGDPRRAQAWQQHVAEHQKQFPGEQLGPEDMDPATGPKIYAAQAGMALESPLDVAVKKAQISKYTREANGSDSYGKTGAIFQGEDGKYYSIQFGANGKKLVEPVAANGAPLTPARGVAEVDDGTGTQIINKASGAPIRRIEKDIAGAATQKKIGEGLGEGAVALPKSENALRQYEATDQIVNGAIDQAVAQSNGWTTGFTGSMTSAVPGTPAHNLSRTLDTIKANLGFDKLQDIRANSPTGGALGAVSDMENQLLQSTWGSVAQSQSQDQLVGNLNKLKVIREQFKDMKRQAFQKDVERFGAANVPNPETGHAQAAPPVRVNTPDEAMSLPPGTHFITPDGREKVRP